MPRAAMAWRRQSRESIQSLVGIELGVRDEAAGIVESGLKEDLLLAAARPPDPGSEQHVALPDLIGKWRFVFFMRVAFSSKIWRSVRPRARRKR